MALEPQENHTHMQMHHATYIGVGLHPSLSAKAQARSPGTQWHIHYWCQAKGAWWHMVLQGNLNTYRLYPGKWHVQELPIALSSSNSGQLSPELGMHFPHPLNPFHLTAATAAEVPQTTSGKSKTAFCHGLKMVDGHILANSSYVRTYVT